MPDAVLTRDGPVAVPLDYKVPQGGELLPLMVRAAVDGTSAASAYYAVVEIVAPSGRIMGIARSDSIAAGASADVTWFPRVGGQQISGSSVLPIQPAFSGDTIVPTALIVGTRATQPTPASFGSSTAHVGFRTIITRTGVLHDLGVYFSSPASGAVEVAILSTDTPTRSIVYKSGYVAVAGADQWQIMGDPALSVTLGDHYDIVFCSDSAPSVFWIGGLINSGSTDASSGQLPTGFVSAPLGAPPKLTWNDTVSPRPYGATTTVDEASLQPQVGVPLVIGRIA